MILFWLICAVFAAIALAFVLPPLLDGAAARSAKDSGRKEANVAVYRDQIAELEQDLRNGIVTQKQFDQDRDELERRLLDDVESPNAGQTKKSKIGLQSSGIIYGVAFGIPILAVALYLRVGNTNALSRQPEPQAQSASANESSNFSQQRMEANVAALARRLEQDSNDVQGWIMLGRSYMTLGKYNEAINAYARATALKPDDADLWADYAFALGMANGQKLEGKPLELINKALTLDPENPKALELAGSAAYESKNYKQAIIHWQKLLDKAPADSELTTALAERISKAKSLATPGER